MNLVNLLGNLFGFSKRSSFLDRYDHRKKVSLGIDYDKAVKSKFPELKKSPRVYNPNCGKSYAQWREEAFGRDSDLKEIEKINKGRANREYQAIENLVVLDKEAKNSRLEHNSRQIRRFNQIIKSDVFSAESNCRVQILKEDYESKFGRIKTSYSPSILTRDVFYAVSQSGKDQKYRRVVIDYFESRLKC